MKLRPELLQLPQIPKPLHGVNPREIMGKIWWDDERTAVFYKQGYRCAACGIHKNDARYHKWLEGHEVYTINYETGEVRFDEIVGLCPSCHKFIHCGLLEIQFKSNFISKQMYEDIMSRGLITLANAGLEPHVVTLIMWLQHTESISDTEIGKRISPEQYKQLCEMNNTDVPWEQWHLVFNKSWKDKIMLFENKKYYSKFKNIKEWEEFYRRKHVNN